MIATQKKLQSLRATLGRMASALIAYSGGVDSTFLLKVAADVLNGKVLAVTAASATYPQEELQEARRIARSLGVRHETISTDELADEDFSANPPQRCYYCKRELFRRLLDIAQREGIAFVLDATNLDDCSDFRPGTKAAKEAGVKSPLVEASLTKADIRALSKEMGLPTWDRPSMACLASRFPYGEAITAEKLARVEQAEKLLRQMGFSQVRVRSHGALARIEVEADRVHRLAEPEVNAKVVEEFKALGFVYVTLDLQGYRSGSLNEPLRKE